MARNEGSLIRDNKAGIEGAERRAAFGTKDVFPVPFIPIETEAFPKMETSFANLEQMPVTMAAGRSHWSFSSSGKQRGVVGEIFSRALGVVAAGVDLFTVPYHGAFRILTTITRETADASKIYIGGAVSLLAGKETPLGKMAANLVSFILVPAAFLCTVLHGIFVGGAKGAIGLVIDKSDSIGNNLNGGGPSYFDHASEYYTGH